MAERLYYIGTTGPFFFNDEETYLNPEDIDFPVDEAVALDPITGDPLVQHGLYTDGPVRVNKAPVADNDILRKVDLLGGIGDVTVPAGFSLIFKGVSPVPDCKLVYTNGMLIIFIGTIVVARFRIPS